MNQLREILLFLRLRYLLILSVLVTPALPRCASQMIFLVVAMGIEPMSENESIRLSPSAAIDLSYRLRQLPIAKSALHYSVCFPKAGYGHLPPGSRLSDARPTPSAVGWSNGYLFTKQRLIDCC